VLKFAQNESHERGRDGRAADMPVSFGDTARGRRKVGKVIHGDTALRVRATITAAAANHVLQQGGLRG
jgi:hypothetical protein